MECEICGSYIPGEGLSIKLEGTFVKACRKCVKLGERVYTRKKESTEKPFHGVRRKKPEKIIEPLEDIGDIIRVNREKAGLTQEQLGSKINEKGSVIARIESGHMRPDMKVARKLERFFGVSLQEEL